MREVAAREPDTIRRELKAAGLLADELGHPLTPSNRADLVRDP